MASVASAAIPRSQADLVAFVDWRGVECLNQSTSHSLDNALKQGYRDDDDLHLESDADEQLLIYIPFTQVIKLHSVIIKGPEEEGPKMVKLFANKEHMGFSNVNDYPPSDSIALSPKNLKERPVNLKYIKFQGVCRCRPKLTPSIILARFDENTKHEVPTLNAFKGFLSPSLVEVK
ncbi:PITH domain-containing protein At3g04780 isoform X2 [Elaeis guineensis]|uniref:PITH domain-containing protein At3g04780 isoform X2 n=1 Tax=Elaeis guineensis var. tenera TaxID=51953 RepID=UPI003C6D85C8